MKPSSDAHMSHVHVANWTVGAIVITWNYHLEKVLPFTHDTRCCLNGSISKLNFLAQHTLRTRLRCGTVWSGSGRICSNYMRKLDWKVHAQYVMIELNYVDTSVQSMKSQNSICFDWPIKWKCIWNLIHFGFSFKCIPICTLKSTWKFAANNFSKYHLNYNRTHIGVCVRRDERRPSNERYTENHNNISEKNRKKNHIIIRK